MNSSEINSIFTEEYDLDLFRELKFEVTRLCNLKCRHCMRGAAQNVTMSKEVIDMVLDQTSGVYKIALTGGETMLVPDVVEYLIDGIIKRNIKVMYFSSVVNGMVHGKQAKKFVSAFDKMSIYIKKSTPIEDGAGASISVSCDEYHGNDPDEAIEEYKHYSDGNTRIIRQDSWKGFKDMHKRALKKYGEGGDLFASGRAEDIGFMPTAIKVNEELNGGWGAGVSPLHYKVEINKLFIYNKIQICANGNVCNGEEVSFQIEDDNCMGNVKDLPLSIMFSRWMYEAPLTKKEVNLLYQIEKYICGYNRLPEEEKNEDKLELYKYAKECLLLKHDAIKQWHEHFPLLSVGECMAGAEAELDMKMDGMYTEMMKILKIFNYMKR